ncbi:hypothetical protein GCM10007421_12030 [Halopseudomonas oceani]|uniref:Uncharacterized protein n=1 Tax=Halopseudomonas oceani TaxID=1708783 RepID=A0A2P4EWX9_9GAMM|nr:hypothetical protein [Halopseudomonas oceani]POB04509.1 hypothetical protein C1949_05925 [Halopseudomonas oceani]GGE39674.1 hypothetical protein GCM10007421_12030 [Halopseudomonas oceani]
MDELKHSGIGIASFVLSIVSAILIFLLIIFAGVLETTTPGGMDEESAVAIVVGLLLFLFMGMSLVGFGLGIGGLVQKGRNKIFAILGTVFSGLTIVGAVMLLLLGMSMA